MRIPSVLLALAALAALGGCAGMRSSSSTSAMGAGPAQATVMCRDAAWVANASDCGSHGGVERAMGGSSR